MFKLTNYNSVIRLSDNVPIPADPANVDYAAYLRWVEAGNTPEPADVPKVPKVSSVTMRQARLALLQAGLLSSVQSSLETIIDETQKQVALIEWEFAATVDRSSPFTQSLASSLGLTEENLDLLFQAASEL